jgi:HAD superfamily hydrolase (TIGR01509 family)
MLVIFDCDGVLVESEHLAARAFSEALGELNIDLPVETSEAWFVGKTLQQCFAQLEVAYPGQLPADFPQRLDAQTQRIFAEHLSAVPGVADALAWIRARGLPRCVASNGTSAKIEQSLRHTQLRDFFGDDLFSAEFVAQPKPAADLYLYAAEAMGVPPGFCVVVEDSFVGMQAGLAAGMRVLLFQPAWRRALFSAPPQVEVFTDMAQLPGLLLRP